MKSKIVLWGSNAQDEKILIAVALRAQDSKVEIRTYPEATATEEFYQQMMKEWRDGEGFELPEPLTHFERELSVSESILPDDLKPERADVVQRAQAEWHFLVLSEKLRVAYEAELAELKERVERVEAYDQSLWDTLKGFWDKLQNQSKERTLSKEHADVLRDNTNVLFARLKEFRSKMDQEFNKVSKDVRDGFMAAFQEIEKKLHEGGRLAPLFDELKRLQEKYKGSRLSREHGNQVWDRLNVTFKAVKDKRFGSKPGGDTSTGGATAGDSQVDRLGRRSDGLRDAIDRMERSIRRDRQELDFQHHKIDTTDGQLEAQIRKAKTIMIEERVRSKEEKLAEMKATQNDLDKRLESQKEREARFAAREAAKKKIVGGIKSGNAPVVPVTEGHTEPEAEVPEVEAQQTPAAVEPEFVTVEAQQAPAVEPEPAVMEEPQAPAIEPEPLAAVAEEKTESILSAAGSLLSESLGDVMDTVKAISSVIGDKIGEAIEDLKETIDAAQERMEQNAEPEAPAAEPEPEAPASMDAVAEPEVPAAELETDEPELVDADGTPSAKNDE